jgi:hypothetical protein
LIIFPVIPLNKTIPLSTEEAGPDISPAHTISIIILPVTGFILIGKTTVGSVELCQSNAGI